MMDDYSIVVEQVTKEYPMYHHVNSGFKSLVLNPKSFIKYLTEAKHVALRNINFKVRKGESVALIGRNGAGKSTMLSMLAGVIKPTYGEIKVKGRVASMLELGGGFHPELSGRDNIRLNATLLGMCKVDIDESINDIIEFSELGDFIDQPIRTYSSGMLAKLGFSVITRCDPDVLIIDEVLAVGDYAFQRKCLDTINDFKKKGVTIFLVSHNMEDVRLFCDSAIWIENREIKAIGDKVKIIEAYLSGC